MRLAMAFDYELCINCRACEVACKEENGIIKGADKHRLWIEVQKTGGDFYALSQNSEEFLPKQCNQCENAFCETVCPVDAIYHNDKGIIITDPDICILCMKCIEACPYHARYVDEERKFVDKCIFCADTRLSRGETTTACQITCPAKLRYFGDIDDENSEISNILKTREYFQFPVGDNGVHLYYLKGVSNNLKKGKNSCQANSKILH